MNIYQPYVYIIRWTNVNKGYIGVRYAKDCHPSDLFVSYHTSSKLVKQLISEVGLPDQIKIFCYSNRETALLMEEKFQRRFRVLDSDYWLNRNINGKGFSVCRGNKHSEKTKSKISQSNKGIPKSKEHRASLSKSRIGKSHSEETKAKIGKSNSGVNCNRYDHTTYTFEKDSIQFSGTRQEFKIKYFGNVINPSIDRLIRKERKSYKGWKIISF